MSSPPFVGCETGLSLSPVIRRSPATVVIIRRVANGLLFPGDLHTALLSLDYDVTRVVATPRAAGQVGVRAPRLGQLLVFARTSLLARLDDTQGPDLTRILRLLQVGVSPQLERSPAWENDESDAYAVGGRRLAASFERVSEAWQALVGGHTPKDGGQA